MKRIANFICKNKTLILMIMVLLLVPSFVGMQLTRINYDILDYLPTDIETVKGQNILTEDFGIGSYSIVIIDNMSSKDILKLEKKIKTITGVSEVISGYDVIGNAIPLTMLPSDITSKMHNDNTDIMLITYDDSISSDRTLSAVSDVKELTKDTCKVGGMSAMTLETMDLSETEILIYIVIAVILCIFILELSLNSYLVPILLLLNIGIAILFNMGTNIIFGEISYITKALVAVLQLGVTMDFSIFLYHSYENKKLTYINKEEAMAEAICETFTAVLGSSLTTIAGFLALCSMELTFGKDLGLVMAKGVLLGVLTTIIVFPVFLLYFDKYIEKTKHKSILPKFKYLNNFVIKYHKIIFVIFLILLIPMYKANTKVEVYYKLDESLPDTLDSIVSSEILKEAYNIVSPEILLISNEMKTNDVKAMVKEIENVEGIDLVLSLDSLGIDKNLFSDDIRNVFESDKYQLMLINSKYDIATNELNSQVEIVQNIVSKYNKNNILAGEGPLMKDLVKISDNDFNNVNKYSIVCILLIMLFVLRSCTLPFLLISVIEFAIFTNMAIPYFGDTILPFVAPIVIGTIQLGATIDYAILMTTTYLKNRKEGITKEESIKDTLSNSVSSIIVSGLCFFGATFGVGLYSQLEMVGSLCTLISRGAIISMIFVILILPSVLLIFDKIIIKTTIGFGKEKNMKNKLKKAVAVIMLICSLFMSTPVYALTKEETVYSKLNSNGTVKTTTASEHLTGSTTEYINDLSNLKYILNISGDEKYTREDDNLKWEYNGNDIFYQGTTTKELPVSVNIKYFLDGKEQELDDILGKSGKIEIKINYKNNDSHMVNGNILYTPFVVMMGTIIDTENNKNVELSMGKTINNGTNVIAVGISSPGLSDSLDINDLDMMNNLNISFETDKFELPCMYFVITPKVLESSDLEVLNKLDDLYDGMDLLKSSMDMIEDGSKQLYGGTTILADVTNKIYSNINQINNTIANMENGSINLEYGLNSIIDILNELKSLVGDDNNDVITSLISENTSSIASIDEHMQNVKNIYDSFDLGNLSNEDIINLTEDFYISKNIPITKEEIFDMNVKLLNIKYIFENEYINNINIKGVLEKNNSTLVENLEKVKKLGNEIDAILMIANNELKKINANDIDKEDIVNSIKTSYNNIMSKGNELYNGINTLNDGSRQLSEGISRFNNEGISLLYSYTKQVESMESKFRSLVSLGEEYQTFTMKNDDMDGTTKFVLTIDAVNVVEEDKNINSDNEKDSFWTKIKNLFKKGE